MNSGRKLKFEMPDGTQIMLEPFQLEDGPIVRVNDVDGFCGGKPACTRPSLCCGDEVRGENDELLAPPGPMQCEPILEHCSCDCPEQMAYEVTFPNGTKYTLEKLIDEELGWGKWIINYDVAGWYTTQIEDVHGNVVTINYKREGKHPEAITSVKITSLGGTARKVIETVLYPEVESSHPEYGLRGKLKELRALGPGDDPAADSSTWSTKYTFDYEERTRTGEQGSPRLQGALLRTVHLPGGVGTIRYDYSDVNLAEEYESVIGIQYPTGGYSEYVYGPFQLGNRRQHDCTRADAWDPTGDQCELEKRRWSRGVIKRTVWPNGKDSGGLNPNYSWVWDRKLWMPDFGRTGTLNSFTLRNPDGTYSVSEMDGDQLGCIEGIADCADGRERSRTFYDSSNAEIRKVEYTYLARESRKHYTTGDTSALGPGTRYAIGMRQKTQVTTYLDDQGVVSGGGFDGSGGSTTRSITVTNLDRGDHNHWRVVRTHGAYLRTPREVFRNYEEAESPVSCRFAKHIHGTFDTKIVQDQALSGFSNVPDEVAPARLETHYEHDCFGSLTGLRQNRSFSTPSADLAGDGTTHGTPSTTGADQGHVRHELSYSTKGNVTDISYLGGDCQGEPGCGTSPEYEAEIGWQNGQAVNAKLSSLGYYARQVGVDDAGFVTSATDPNGLKSTFGYDALGRVTSIAPPSGSGEHPTRIAYPSLNETRISTAAGSSANYSFADASQLYTEQRYDGLGRTIEVRKAVPDGSGGRLVKQMTRYDEMGRVVFRSTWVPADACEGASSVTCTSWTAPARDLDADGSSDDALVITGIPLGASGVPLGTVTFYGEPSSSDPYNPLAASIDALGRVREVVNADGTRQSKRYCGPHEELRVSGIQSDLSGGTAESVTRLYKDGHGNLVLVDADASAGANGAGADAAYEYDLRGRLVRVNLVENLTSSDPFGAWKSGAFWNEGQMRRFRYNALGRLVESEQPEDGLKRYQAYDVLGKLLEWKDAKGIDEGYHFENVYEDGIGGTSTGRLTSSKKVLNSAQASGNWSSPEGFDSLTEWREGSLDSGVYTEGPTLWRAAPYKTSPSDSTPGRCVESTLAGQGPGSNALFFGDSGCSYGSAPATTQLLCQKFDNVSRDDRIDFLYWRHVRQSETLGSGTADELAVWVMLAANDFAKRRVVFQASESHPSLRRWRRAPHVALGTLFSENEWAPGALKHGVQVCFAFTKEDTDPTGLGTGVAIDNFRLGRPAEELLVEQTYDEDHCQSGVGGDVCVAGTANRVNGQLTTVRSYQDGTLVGTRRWAYQGLNGRVSGVQQVIDWTGVDAAAPELAESWTWKLGYDAFGQLTELGAPQRAQGDLARDYGMGYARGVLDDVFRSKDGTATSFLGNGGLVYNDAGALLELHFANGTKQTITRDKLSRPGRVTSRGVNDGILWDSGDYAYDGAGNIKAIGEQQYAYDAVGRLVQAKVTEQVALAHQDPSARPQHHLQYTYDAFGNMESRSLSTDSPPAISGLEFSFLHYDTSKYEQPHDTKNQIVHSGFTYDKNGNMKRFTGKLGTSHQVGAAWDAVNRMRVFYEGDPEQGGTPAESYLYDAGGYRLVAIGRTGLPRASLRNASGLVLSEFVVDHEQPGAPLTLDRDFIYGAGQLLLERRVTEAPPTIMSADSSTMGLYGFAVTSGAEPGASFAAEISAPSGFRNLVSGITLDANNRFTLPEAELSPDESNYVQLRRENGLGSGLFAALTVAVDTSVLPNSENQIRSIGASWSGTDIVVRWQLREQNNKPVIIRFRDAATGTTYQLHPQALPPGTSQLVLPSQALQAPSGSFEGLQQNAGGGLTGPSLGGNLGSGAAGYINFDPGGGTSGGTTPQPPQEGYTFAESYHHRDHLGSLRVASTGSGVVEVGGRADLYPFGMRMSSAAVGGSRRLFTGHERDRGSGLDYMMARYDAATLGRFLAPDPGEDVNPVVPVSWNHYGYVGSNPLNGTDPTGMMIDDLTTPGAGRRAMAARVEQSGKGAAGSKSAARSMNRNDQQRGVAIAYGALKVRVKPGDVLVLKNSEGQNVHVAIVGAVKNGQVYVYENVPQDAPVDGKIAGHTDTQGHTPILKNSNAIVDQETGRAPRYRVGGAAGVVDVEVRRNSGFSVAEVADAVAAVGKVTYANVPSGNMGPKTDCVGLVNQAVDNLKGRLNSKPGFLRRWGGQEHKGIEDW